MITPERVYEVFGITPGPWEINDEVDFDSFISGDTGKYKNVICQPLGTHSAYKTGEYPPWDNNKNLIKASPEMLVTLVNMVIELSDRFSYQGFHGDFKLIFDDHVKAIESADSQNLKWPELLKELKR